MDLVSTIIPVYNREHMLERAVNSVLAQTYKTIEIIIVNDGSTDDTGKVAERLSAQSTGIIKVLHIENSGAGLAREAGRQLAKGDYIQYLDSDDWLLPNKFSDQLEALKLMPNADIAYGVTRLVDQHGNTLAEPSKDTGLRREQLFPYLLVNRWWHTSTPLYSKRISDLAGAWPDKRPEDWDLEARMAVHNPVLAYVDQPVSCHLEHEEPGRVSHGAIESYLLDEAWFLPRLYQCASKAGVEKSSVEMIQFSKWAFMRARHLGALGHVELAEQLFTLSLTAAEKPSLLQGVVKIVVKFFGWKVIGNLGHFVEKIRND